MKILVTGGAGYVGANLIKALNADSENHQLYSLDNYISGKESREIPECKYYKGS